MNASKRRYFLVVKSVSWGVVWSSPLVRAARAARAAVRGTERTSRIYKMEEDLAALGTAVGQFIE
jgi:hypothetical protein